MHVGLQSHVQYNQFSPDAGSGVAWKPCLQHSLQHWQQAALAGATGGGAVEEHTSRSCYRK